MFLCSVILEHCCGFPKDPEGPATFERLAAVSHLQRSLSSPLIDVCNESGSRCDLFILLAMSCIISIAQSDMITIACSRHLNVPRASLIPFADALPSRRHV